MQRQMFSRRRFLTLTGATLAVGLWPDVVVAQAERAWTAIGLEVPELNSFEEAVKDFMQARGIRSGALAVTRGGHLMLARGYGWSDDPADIAQPTSLFRIASLSKSLTAVGILRLAQDGALALDQLMVEILDLQPPRDQTADPQLSQVTIRHLLQHLGGWDWNVSFDPMFEDRQIARALRVDLPLSQQDIITYMTGQPLDFAPGTRYAYSNYGYLLLGRVIEQVTGQPYDVYMQQQVFAPLGMSGLRLGSSRPDQRAPGEVSYYTRFRRRVRSVYDESERTSWPYGGWNLENMDSHGGWLASVLDMARFVASFDDPAHHPVLSQPAITQLFSAPAIGSHVDGWYYACGWLVQAINGGGITAWHDGSLDGTFTLMVRRWDGINWVVLFNQRDDPSRLPYLEAIDAALHEAADAVQQWPARDLFVRIG